jgi:hypothetical protein
LKVWVGGDSVGGSFAPGVQHVCELTKLCNAETDFKVSSGLANQAFYNWPKHLRDIARDKNPDVMVLLIGANDAQPLSVDNRSLPTFSPEWLAEYRKRVGSTMDLMRSPKSDRLVIWVGLPVMGPKTAAKGMDKLNYIIWDEARTRPWVAYFDSWPYFTDDQGVFAYRLPMADGKEQKVREGDGVHLTPQGARRLGWAVYGRLGKYVDLSASSIIVPVGELAPPTVQERPEAPKPPDWPS